MTPCYISVLAQSEVKENDEANLKKLEELRANIVKTSNEASLVFADMENELTELEVFCNFVIAMKMDYNLGNEIKVNFFQIIENI